MQLSRPTVLVVDDEAPILEVVERTLMLHWQVCTAGDPEAAHAELATRAIDAVISDFHLGPHDGLTVLRMARELHPRAHRVLMSGSSYAFAHSAGLAHRLLSKPFSALELVACLPPRAADPRP